MTTYVHGQIEDCWANAITNMSKMQTNTVVSSAPAVYDICELFADQTKQLPIHTRVTWGAPGVLKRFESVKFLGRNTIGTFRVRIYIDGSYVCDSRVTLSRQPSRHNKVNIPIGRQVGYTIDVEFAGIADPRSVIVVYRAVQ